MSYIVEGLDGSEFQHLYGLSDEELASHGAIRVKVDEYPGYPDRITLRDIPVGEFAILLNHAYLQGLSPYRGSHAIFIWEGKLTPAVVKDRLPEVMASRLLSLRVFDKNDMMIDADIVPGDEAEQKITSMLDIAQATYILVHNAKRGCFSCRVTRGRNQ